MSNSLNRVTILGNVTRDPEVKFTPKGTAVTDLGLALNRSYTNPSGEKVEETVFVDVEIWGRTAEVAGEYAKKGRQILIEGRLRMDTWEDKTGQKRSRLKVVCENLHLLGGKPASGRTGSDEEATDAPRRQQAPAPPPDEGEIPF